MAIRFYNTLTRRIEDFQPLEEGKVGLYTCGPTVYNLAHIGNFRAFVFCDLLRRYLKYRGFKVFHVMNLTDVDDKTIRDSTAEGIPLGEFTARYKRAFFEDRDTLRIEPVEIYPEATEHIPDMVRTIERLTERGHTYVADGSTYFKIDTFPSYGKFANLDLSGMRAGTRIAADTYEKEDARDFVLWKAWTPEDGSVFWDTPLGRGRPGWHIECSAMSQKYLGETFDIHGGGVDLIFPHHQNEIAQAEGATGKPFVRYWLHSEFLLVDGQKMSKSLGNFYTLRDVLERGYRPMEVRYVLLGTHYRQQLNFTFDGLAAARGALERLRDFAVNVRLADGKAVGKALDEIIEQREGEFVTALDDDLNIAPALGAVFNFVRDVSRLISENRLAKEDSGKVLSKLSDWNKVLGFMDLEEEVLTDDEVIRQIERRREARERKDWAKADEIRGELERKGILLEDRATGTIWKRK
ncbi:MAG: cysteine--tRNA ligase [bacterium]